MKTLQELSQKPYYRCFTCDRFRNTCGGRPTRDMDLENWCKYMRDVKDFAHLTNAYIAKEAEVSLTTIERIMAINTDQDIMRATARRIERVIIGNVGEFTCYLDYDDSTCTERINRLLAEIEFWRKENERKAKIIDKYLD